MFNTLKVKLSLMANFFTALSLIILGVLSFYFTKTYLYDNELKRQNDILQVARTSLETFRKHNSDLILNLEKQFWNFHMKN